MRRFKEYKKEELLNLINQLSIERVNDQIVTKYGNRVLKVSNVSKRYEIFDIVSYLRQKIETIESNFTISKYHLSIVGGQQFLQLVSDSVNINGIQFHKSFYILNSTDKSRRLSFYSGLHSDSFYFIGGKNAGLSKKHLKGVTSAAEVASTGLSGETFSEQIESISSLVGHRIKLSKIREVILGNNEEIPSVNHRKFDAFRNTLRHDCHIGLVKLTTQQRNSLLTPSERLTEVAEDFYLDAFYVFSSYMKLFNKQDSHIIKKETDRIMGITQWSVRNSILESLGI
jgi:hypothetical protein